MTIPFDSSSNSGNLLSKQRTNGYILHSSVNITNNPSLVVALSTQEILLFDLKSQAKTLTLKGHTQSITGIKYSQQEPHTFLSSSLDGNIHVWDTRSGMKPVQTFFDDSGGNLKPFLCFDYNSVELYICGGTELVREDSFLVFWDRRSARNLGGYWESHTDDITHVQFDRSVSSGLASSSVDGLINIFDLNESCEDDALVTTINTESSVNKFSWHSGGNISCITGMEEYQLWSVEQTKPSLQQTRKAITKSSDLTVDYLVDCFVDKKPFNLVTGSNTGTVHFHQNGSDSLTLTAVLKGGHTGIVRTLSCCKDDCFVTGGEDGVLCLWKLNFH